MQVYIPSFNCPHCNTTCSFSGKGVGDCVTLYCRGCHKGVFFQLKDRDFPDNDQDTARVDASVVVDYYPRLVVIADKAIPEDIADDFEEANKCFSVEAKKATVTMCRRVLQSTCICKGADPKKDLFRQDNRI